MKRKANTTVTGEYDIALNYLISPMLHRLYSHVNCCTTNILIDQEQQGNYIQSNIGISNSNGPIKVAIYLKIFSMIRVYHVDFLRLQFGYNIIFIYLSQYLRYQIFRQQQSIVCSSLYQLQQLQVLGVPIFFGNSYH